MIKHILCLHHSPAAKKIIQKINALLKEPEDEGGWVAVEPLRGK